MIAPPSDHICHPDQEPIGAGAAHGSAPRPPKETILSNSPYDILGVAPSASDADIKKAYRKLAKELHPDLHPGDAGKEAEFQALSAAYDLLKNPETRARFDAGEIDAAGHERPRRPPPRQQAGTGPHGRYEYQAGPEDFGEFADIFEDLFRSRQGQSQGGARAGDFRAAGGDLRYALEVDFLDAALGARKTLTLANGGALEVSIPRGFRDGQTLRLRGKGQPGFGGGPSGDALITVHVRPHPTFARTGNDIEVEVPVTFDQAVLGGKIEVPTVAGPVSMTIPAGVSSGHRLRLKGKGINPAKGTPGDQVVRLKIVLPKAIDAEMEELARKWRAHVGPAKQRRTA